MEDTPYIVLDKIDKSFGPVHANRNVSLSVRKGEIHALLGENGSGKSTLVNMLAGIYAPDSGRIFLGGKEMHFASPRDAIDAGIGMVHQHFKLVDVLSAKENIVLGRPGGLFLNTKTVARQIAALGEKYGLTVHPDRKIYEMSVSEKQTVEILKILYRGADVLILDEPTAVLTPQETEALFAILRNMRQDAAIIIITHKMHEVLSISDRVTVLRKGEAVGTVNTAETDARQLTEMMVGRPITLEIERPQADPALRKELLRVERLSCKGPDGNPILDGMTFTLHGGEILGVAGIAGSGQKELCEIIAGLRKASGGSVVFQGEPILGMTPREMIRRGLRVSFIPEDRLGMGLVGGLPIVENVMLKTFRRGKGPFLDRAGGRSDAERIVKEFSIDTPSVNHIVNKLSGGNIQKVLLGREIDLSPELLITSYPVRGLDIGASYFIYEMLNTQKKKGVGILFIGEDLDVLLEIADRILVMHGGRCMGIVDPTRVTKEDIGLMMLGQGGGVS